jgi:hypothetical protein
MMASGDIGISLAFTITAAKTNTSSISSKLLQNTDELSICLALTGYPSIVVVQSSTNTISPSSAPTSSPGDYLQYSLLSIFIFIFIFCIFIFCIFIINFIIAFIFTFTPIPVSVSISLPYFHFHFIPKVFHFTCVFFMPTSFTLFYCPCCNFNLLPHFAIHISCVIYISYPTLPYKFFEFG